MAEDAEEFLYYGRRLKEIKEEMALLDDKVSGVQRALVEFRAFNISRSILSNLMTEIIWRWLDEGDRDNDMVRKHNEIGSELRVALASLRGKLAEEAVPEDAFKYWIKDARKRLSGIVGAEEADSLIPSSYDWGKIIGLPGLEVEE